jgi:release factor glutamine methyltransferase
MTINTWLVEATSSLKKAGIETARLDALILLEDTLNRDRSWLLAHDDTEISSEYQASLNNLFEQRLKHTPLAYLRGRSEFYGRSFVISRDVLVPRPESEAMIDQLKDIASKLNKDPSKLRVLDVGTGSGALAISAALELNGAIVEALDSDDLALETAKTNVDLFTLKINVFKSDLLFSILNYYDILLCNLPYVPDDYNLNEAAKHEPPIALFGGKDGLDLYRRLFKQVDKLTKKPLYILTESLPMQHSALVSLASLSGYKLTKTDRFIEVFKLAKA